MCAEKDLLNGRTWCDISWCDTRNAGNVSIATSVSPKMVMSMQRIMRDFIPNRRRCHYVFASQIWCALNLSCICKHLERHVLVWRELRCRLLVCYITTAHCAKTVMACLLSEHFNLEFLFTAYCKHYIILHHNAILIVGPRCIAPLNFLCKIWVSVLKIAAIQKHFKRLHIIQLEHDPVVHGLKIGCGH